MVSVRTGRLDSVPMRLPLRYLAADDVAAAMQPPLAAVEADESLDEVFSALSGGSPAVVVAVRGTPSGMLTRSDLLEYLAHRS